ncbi:MAG: hypothetical protein HOE66_04950 [Planctomycetes bacterium]|nr:hypothetical protein [Planctomycetota bacterium]MBT4560219.1 hypothetical protein [Planctomycetota bacterium]
MKNPIQTTRALLIVTLTLLAISFLGSCSNSSRPTADQSAGKPVTNVAGGAPTAAVGAIPAPPKIAPPTGEQTLYVAMIRDKATKKPISRAKVMVLTERPTDAYMRTPRRKTVVWSYYTPLHGQASANITADGAPKFLWIGGDGFNPKLYELPSAVGGQRHDLAVEIAILPICKMKVVSSTGELCPDAIVTMKPADGSATNYGTTSRAGDDARLKFTRPPGQYTVIATKANGTCRLTTTIDFKGDPKELVMTLPSKSPGK